MTTHEISMQLAPQSGTSSLERVQNKTPQREYLATTQTLPRMGLGRVELPTSRLSGVRSNHLSYRPLRLPFELRNLANHATSVNRATSELTHAHDARLSLHPLRHVERLRHLHRDRVSALPAEPRRIRSHPPSVAAN